MRNPNRLPAEPRVAPRVADRGPAPYVVTANDAVEHGKIADRLFALWFRKSLVAGLTAAGLLIAAGIAVLWTPTYRGQASIEVVGNESDVQTQAEILGDDSLLAQVVSKLKLDQRPEFLARPDWNTRLRVALGQPTGWN